MSDAGKGPKVRSRTLVDRLLREAEEELDGGASRDATLENRRRPSRGGGNRRSQKKKGGVEKQARTDHGGDPDEAINLDLPDVDPIEPEEVYHAPRRVRSGVWAWVSAVVVGAAGGGALSLLGFSWLITSEAGHDLLNRAARARGDEGIVLWTSVLREMGGATASRSSEPAPLAEAEAPREEDPDRSGALTDGPPSLLEERLVSQLRLLKVRNRLTDYGDRAIALGERSAYEALLAAMIDEEYKPHRAAVRTEVLRVQFFYAAGSRIAGFKLPLASLFGAEAPADEGQVSTEQLAALLRDRSQVDWPVRVRSAYLLGSRKRSEALPVLVEAVRSDPNLDVLKESLYSFEELTGFRSREILDSRGALEWWESEGAAALGGAATGPDVPVDPVETAGNGGAEAESSPPAGSR